MQIDLAHIGVGVVAFVVVPGVSGPVAYECAALDAVAVVGLSRQPVCEVQRRAVHPAPGKLHSADGKEQAHPDVISFAVQQAGDEPIVLGVQGGQVSAGIQRDAGLQRAPPVGLLIRHQVA